MATGSDYRYIAADPILGANGEILAQTCCVETKTPNGCERYTADVDFDGYIEEIDVDANNRKNARAQVLAELEKNYVEGGKIKSLIVRHGVYI